MLSYLKELFNPSTIKGSILCGIAAAVLLSGFTYILQKLFKKPKGDDYSMDTNTKKSEIDTVKSTKANTKEDKQIKNRDVNNFDEIKIKGNINGTVNIGSGNIKIENKK